uniref:Si:ch73-23l24.1 n=1 Tax=Salmo trutta TaxID=8032 RepID=A0A673YEF2_SALTR
MFELGAVECCCPSLLSKRGPAGGGREKRSMPNWALTSSDFFSWVEALREHAGYEKIEDLSRTFWAHFPSASRPGYELSDPDEE